MRKTLSVYREIFLVFTIAFVAGCGAAPTPPPTATPDASATSAAATTAANGEATRIAAAVAQALTAAAPTITPTPSQTATPSQTPTAVPTNTPTATLTPAPTDTPLPTNTPAPTATPRPRPTNTPTPAPPPLLEMNVKGALGSHWDVTLVGIHRDKTLYYYSSARAAFGVYATFLMRIKNKQTGTDYIGHEVSWAVLDETGTVSIYKPLTAPDEYGAYMFCGCATFYSYVQPGTETVAALVMDVPIGVKELRLIPYVTVQGNVIAVEPAFVIHNFDQVPVWKPN